MTVRGADGFPGFVTTRYGIGTFAGVSRPPYDSFNLGSGVNDDPEAVAANRATLAEYAQLAPDRLIFMGQVHGTTVAEVTGPSPVAIANTDAMVSAATGIGLAVLVADCVPVLAGDAMSGVIGVAHAGRVGAAGGIVPAMIGRMIGLGATEEELEVFVGPAICGLCYEVPAAMRDEVDAALPGSACVTSGGTAGLDLRAGIRRQLHELGVRTVNSDARCTREDPVLFSHRRSSRTGRFAAVITQ